MDDGLDDRTIDAVAVAEDQGGRRNRAGEVVVVEDEDPPRGGGGGMHPRLGAIEMPVSPRRSKTFPSSEAVILLSSSVKVVGRGQGRLKSHVCLVL
jgi:hypothetical protein